MNSQARNEKSKQQMLARRRKSFFSKGSELNKRCNVHVYAVVYGRGRFHIFNSHPQDNWLQSEEQLVSLNLAVGRKLTGPIAGEMVSSAS
jgi:hypothetical protein